MPEQTISAENDPRRIDLKTVIATLRAGNASSEWFARWLPKTYAEPELFQQALYAHANLRRRGIRSAPDHAIELYDDCVLAHVGQNKKALVVRNHGVDASVSYDELDARTGGLMLAWQRQGVCAGQCVCILIEVGVEYAVALLTAVRMGLVVCCLPPWGATFLRNRVEALEPDYVVATTRQLVDLRPLELTALSLSAPRESSTETHSYAPDEPVLRSFSAFGSAELEAVEVAAGPLHGALLRDGFLVWALDGKDVVAAPDFDPRVLQPTALLSTLLAGATWSEWRVAELTKDPKLLEAHAVTLLGASQTLANWILDVGKWPAGGVRAWFRSLTCPIDFSTFSALGQLSAKADVAAFNLGYCAATGGVLLAGPPNREPLGLQAWPPAGEPWELAEVGASGLQALNDSGVYTSQRNGKAAPGAPQLLLTRGAEGYLCAGAIDTGPEATAYPIEEVSKVVERLPGVRYASVVVSPGSTANQARVTLIAFVNVVGPNEAASPAVTVPELQQRIEREMGARFLPTRVEIFALRPRLSDGVLDHGWCRSQYLSGALTTKADQELFQLLSRLGSLFDVSPQVIT